MKIINEAEGFTRIDWMKLSKGERAKKADIMVARLQDFVELLEKVYGPDMKPQDKTITTDLQKLLPKFRKVIENYNFSIDANTGSYWIDHPDEAKKHGIVPLVNPKHK